MWRFDGLARSSKSRSWLIHLFPWTDGERKYCSDSSTFSFEVEMQRQATVAISSQEVDYLEANARGFPHNRASSHQASMHGLLIGRSPSREPRRHRREHVATMRGGHRSDRITSGLRAPNCGAFWRVWDSPLLPAEGVRSSSPASYAELVQRLPSQSQTMWWSPHRSCGKAPPNPAFHQTCRPERLP